MRSYNINIWSFWDLFDFRICEFHRHWCDIFWYFLYSWVWMPYVFIIIEISWYSLLPHELGSLKSRTWIINKKPIAGFCYKYGCWTKNRGILPPKWMVKMVETLWTNGWFGGGKNPYFWKHPYVQMGFVSTNMVTSVVQHVRWKEQLIIHTNTLIPRR